VLGVLVGGLGSMGLQCEAATFICQDGQGAANPGSCRCKADGVVCADMGDCLAACPLESE
jgi:hypothetical protein